MCNPFTSKLCYIALLLAIYLLPCPKIHGSASYLHTINKCITTSPSPNAIPLPVNYDIINAWPALADIKCIVIDAGHGGKDSGCHGHNIKEKVISLTVAKKFRDLLRARYPEVKIVMTREKDVFIPLHKRAKIANDNHADLFISIHCNSAPQNPNAQGTETYVMGLHRAEDNLNVAKRENESILLEENYQNFYGGFDPNAPSTHILMSMFQNAYLDQSIVFADMIERQSKNQFKRRTRGVKQAGFAVLRLTTMPSVLFETGFLSNKHDAKYLNSFAGQNNLAQQLLDAFSSYQSDLNKNMTENPPAIYVHNTTSENISSPTVVTAQKDKTDNHQDYYCLQLACTSKQLRDKPNNWHNLNDIYTIPYKKGYKYVCGKYLNKNQAKNKLKQLNKWGVNDAFISKFPKGADRAF